LPRLVAVHATDRFPADGKVLAGLDGADFDDRPNLAVLTHWALGGLVPAHLAGEWETKRYAVIAPFDELVDRAVNVFAQDTGVLGDVQLTERDVVVVPHGANIDASRHPFEVVEARPDQTLRESVDQVLADRALARVAMGADTGMLGDPAILEGRDINAVEFTEELRADHPALRSGSSMSHPLHQTSFPFQVWVERSLPGAMAPSSASELRNGLLAARENLRMFEVELAEHRLGPAARVLVDRRLEDARAWLALLETELKLQDEHSLSFVGTNKALRDRAVAARTDRQRLRQLERELIAANAPGQRVPPRREPVADVRRWPTMLQHLTLEQFRDFGRSFDRTDWTARTNASVIAEYVANRLLRSDVGEDEVPQLLAFLDESARPLSDEQRTQMVLNLYRWPVREYLRPHRLERAARFEALANIPSLRQEFRQLLARDDGLDVPETGPLRFESIGRPLVRKQYFHQLDQAMDAVDLTQSYDKRSMQSEIFRRFTEGGRRRLVSTLAESLDSYGERWAALEALLERGDAHAAHWLPEDLHARLEACRRQRELLDTRISFAPDHSDATFNLPGLDVTLKDRGTSVCWRESQRKRELQGIDALNELWDKLRHALIVATPPRSG
jgi:hypothetical protein